MPKTSFPSRSPKSAIGSAADFQLDQLKNSELRNKPRLGPENGAIGAPVDTGLLDSLAVVAISPTKLQRHLEKELCRA
jgi:hypothetical protein